MTAVSLPVSSRRALRLAWLAAVLMLAVPLALRVSRLLGSGGDARIMEVVDYLFDDAYYYLQIAANLAETGRSTFDGITLTNGYQPLWLLMLGALAKLVGTDPRTFYVAACILVYAIALGTVVAPGLRRDAAGDGGALPAAIGLALAALSGFAIFLQGLESVLFLPLALPLFVLVERAAEGRGLVALSGVLALAFLVRLDALALAATTGFVAIAVPLLMRRIALGEALRRCAWLGAILVPTIVAYALVNQWIFGSPVPISGLAKAIGAPRFSNWGAGLDFFTAVRLKIVVPLGVVWATLEWLVRRRGDDPGSRYYRPMAVLVLAVPLQALYYCAFSGWYAWPWYFYSAALVMALVCARVIHLAARLDGGARVVGLVAVAMILARVGVDSTRLWRDSQPPPAPVAEQPPATYSSFNRVSLAMLREFPPAKEGRAWIAMGDRAGGLAYWGRARLSVAQTEGLVLDRAYIAARIAGRGREYLESTFPIDWFVVDRQVVPTLEDADGRRIYVVADPIQGRVTQDPVPLFCFPASALRWSLTYSLPEGPTRRLAFDFAARMPCNPEAVSIVRGVEQGSGLRLLSLPGEYHLPGGPTRKALEARDRALLYNSRPLQGRTGAPLQESP